jgi:hypothetical protein
LQHIDRRTAYCSGDSDLKSASPTLIVCKWYAKDKLFRQNAELQSESLFRGQVTESSDAIKTLATLSPLTILLILPYKEARNAWVQDGITCLVRKKARPALDPYWPNHDLRIRRHHR